MSDINFFITHLRINIGYLENINDFQIRYRVGLLKYQIDKIEYEFSISEKEKISEHTRTLLLIEYFIAKLCKDLDVNDSW
jgi:hypothetical protein